MSDLKLFRDYHHYLTGEYPVVEAIDRFLEMAENRPDDLVRIAERIQQKKERIL